ncbi:hypothetical protein BKA82DRAFT_50442, partial [Pisolithus tinctorius]
KNWPLWKSRLETLLRGRNLLGYLHGTKAMPIDPRVGNSPAWIPMTIAEMAEMADYDADLEEQMQKDALIQEHVTASIPDSLYMCLISKS